MKTLTTSLFIVGAALAVSACGTGYDGSPYFASGRTASYGSAEMTATDKSPMAEPSAVRSERVFKATQAK